MTLSAILEGLFCRLVVDQIFQRMSLEVPKSPACLHPQINIPRTSALHLLNHIAFWVKSKNVSAVGGSYVRTWQGKKEMIVRNMCMYIRKSRTE